MDTVAVGKDAMLNCIKGSRELQCLIHSLIIQNFQVDYPLFVAYLQQK